MLKMNQMLKIAIVALLITGTAISLQVSIDEQVKEVKQGDIAKYEIRMTNDEVNDLELNLEAHSEVPTSFSDEEITLDPNESRTEYLFAFTDELEKGTYTMDLEIDGESKSLALKVKDGASAIKLYNSYGELRLKQGSTGEVKLVARNNGEEKLENIVVKSDLPEELEPEYPMSFSLLPEEEKEISILVNVPDEYTTGKRTFQVSVASGSITATKEVKVNVLEAEPIKGKLEMELAGPVEKYDKEGETVGYKLTFDITNKEVEEIENIKWGVETPEEWNLTGNENFSVEEGQMLQKTIRIDTGKDFSKRKVEVKLLKEGKEITSTEVEVGGEKVGVRTTGMILGSFSPLYMGILAAVAVIIILFLYVRKKNKEIEEQKKEKDKKYLERLVDETVSRGKDEDLDKSEGQVEDEDDG